MRAVRNVLTKSVRNAAKNVLHAMRNSVHPAICVGNVPMICGVRIV